MAVIRALLVVDEITRDGAGEAAREELSKGKYQAGRPGLVEQLATEARDWLNRGLNTVADGVPGGPIGLIILALLFVGAVVAIRLRTGPLARGARSRDPFGEFAATLSPAEHRRLADDHEAAGRLAEAVLERLRAIVSDLEERAILEPRLGRTADEVARDAGAALPAVAPELQRAARTFDDVWYGERPATAQMCRDLRETDRLVQAARPTNMPQSMHLAVPR